MKRRKFRKERIRVNFDMEKEDYEKIQELAERTDTDVSKIFRAMARELIRKSKKDAFAGSLVFEKDAGILQSPTMPEVEEQLKKEKFLEEIA